MAPRAMVLVRSQGKRIRTPLPPAIKNDLDQYTQLAKATFRVLSHLILSHLMLSYLISSDLIVRSRSSF